MDNSSRICPNDCVVASVNAGAVLVPDQHSRSHDKFPAALALRQYQPCFKMNKEEKKGERCNVNRLPSVISQGEVFLNKGLELDLLQWHKGPMVVFKVIFKF